ncbi:helix-turn-helix transcriptional regulator, partial [Enterococcus faecium]|uniref:helix-turn-helix domain-containing protein n=1 Tax=Enterococcus faecium TaxID=1352 RepID=UPI0028919E7A
KSSTTTFWRNFEIFFRILKLTSTTGNPNYLSNVFKKETGEKFGDFVQNHRLEVAKKWLKETNLSVKEIAERLQYRNPQNFIRFFKKKESITPGEYRKKYL